MSVENLIGKIYNAIHFDDSIENIDIAYSLALDLQHLDPTNQTYQDLAKALGVGNIEKSEEIINHLASLISENANLTRLKTLAGILIR